MELGLKGKRVIIPASTKGILRRVVDQLVDEGCDVAICSVSYTHLTLPTNREV